MKRAGMEATRSRLGAVLGLSWGRLGASLAPLGVVLGPPWGSWGGLGAILWHLGAILRPSSTSSDANLRNAQTCNTSHTKCSFLLARGSQDGPKMSQVGPSWAQVWILEATWSHLGGNLANKMASWRQVGDKLEVRWPKVAKTYKKP